MPPNTRIISRRMPIYEYECKECGERVEKIQRFDDRPLESCDSCGGSLKRLISVPAIQFRGGGWYSDGYSQKPVSNKDKKSEPKSEPKKADPKPKKKDKGKGD